MAKDDMLLYQTGSDPCGIQLNNISDAIWGAPGFPASFQLLLQKTPGLLEVLCHIVWITQTPEHLTPKLGTWEELVSGTIRVNK